MARVAVIGAGYVGLTTAACLADLGHRVTGVDTDARKVAALQEGHVPIFEPGLDDMVTRNFAAGRLSFTTSYGTALSGAEVAFIAVATPEGEAGEADLTALRRAAEGISQAVTGDLVVVNKSTVPIGTGDIVAEIIHRSNGRYRVDVVSNPEFLREGSALHDFMHPDRVVIGGHSRAACEAVAALYRPVAAPVILTTLYTAEMIKYASNAFLATRISFINEIARICDRVGADVKEVAAGMGMDTRIGPRFLEAGVGFGGSCFPKDVKALTAIARRYDYHPELLEAVLDINNDQRRLAVELVEAGLGSVEGKLVCLLGLAFKPDTDDLREAPSLEIARLLMLRGARVTGYDPVAGQAARRALPELRVRQTSMDAAEGSDAVILVTEWPEFTRLDLAGLRRVMRGNVLVDGRNALDPAAAREAGFDYRGIGRSG